MFIVGFSAERVLLHKGPLISFLYVQSSIQDEDAILDICLCYVYFAGERISLHDGAFASFSLYVLKSSILEEDASLDLCYVYSVTDHITSSH